VISTGISTVRVPILIPKRGKGHNEVLGAFQVQSTSMISPIEFVPPLTSKAGKAFLVDHILELSREVVNSLKVKNAVVSLEFHLMLDRVSPAYSTVYFPLTCLYTGSAGKGVKEEFSITVSLPVRVRDIHPVSGTLVFSIINPSHLFVEDLVDHIQKSAGVVLYPLSAAHEIDQLQQTLDQGLTPYEYLTLLEDASTGKKLGDGGTAQIQIKDIYRMYDFTYTASWRNS